MRREESLVLLLPVLAAWAVSACFNVEEPDDGSQGDAGEDSGTDSGTDVDSDSDTDADVDTDIDTETGTEVDTDTETGAEPPCEDGEVVEFADGSIENAVRWAVGVPSGPLYCEDVQWLTELDVSEAVVEDLEGVQVLTSLVVFNLSYNNALSEIGPLSGLKSLSDLRLFWDFVSDLSPLAELTSLTYLDLGQNQVSDLGALVANEGIDAGDVVLVGGNLIDEVAQSGNIVALCERGVCLLPYCSCE